MAHCTGPDTSPYSSEVTDEVFGDFLEKTIPVKPKSVGMNSRLHGMTVVSSFPRNCFLSDDYLPLLFPLTCVTKQRLDALLVERGLCSSRQRAQRLIRAGEVFVNRQIIDKPGTEVLLSAEIEVKQPLPFVSRGGEKLAKALQVFPIVVAGRICLDGGISTGGFTDCLLQAGAKRVYGVDVGYGQVAWRLRQDARVVLKERTNLRHLLPKDLYGEIAEIDWPDLGVVDVSFISLTKVLPALHALLQPPREMILLVKPQFEVGRAYFEQVDSQPSGKVASSAAKSSKKKGVVRDPAAQQQTIWRVLQAANALGWQYCGLTWSPLPGPAGNIEYLLWLRDRSNSAAESDAVDSDSDISPATIESVVSDAWQSLVKSSSSSSLTQR